jgi:hypothetical protein
MPQSYCLFYYLSNFLNKVFLKSPTLFIRVGHLFISFVFSFFIALNGRIHAYSLPALAFVLSLWQRVGVSALLNKA